jgi:hypothetical protein
MFHLFTIRSTTMKAEIGKVTRKFFGPETSTKKSLNSSNYHINMTECKSLVEISPGEIVTEEDYEDMKLAVELINAQLKALNAWMSCR